MKRFTLLHASFFTVCAFLSAQENQNQKTVIGRERLLMDNGWRFAFGNATDTKKDFNYSTGYFSYLTKAGYGDGPAAKDFDDRAWRKIDLPHDWAAELPFDQKAGYSHGFKTVGRNFPETSIGWYRKSFFVPSSDMGRRISIEFDGVHRNSIVWVNGFYLGETHSGYYGFQYDISEYLNYGGENVVVVRADATFEEGWYYEGAGIYRHVWLNKTSPLHMKPYGIFITSEILDTQSELTVRAEIVNQNNTGESFYILFSVVDTEGKIISSETINRLFLRAGEEKQYFKKITVAQPILWSIDMPYLYRLVTEVKKGDWVADKTETNFGIRTLKFDPNEGFFMNGKHVLLKGTNNHQDHAGVGVALPDALQEFRIKQLKAMGSNAYRCSHNPPTPELLDACDRLGMLVLDENRLMGVNEEHLAMLKNMILRDRNHPSVFVWSLGNEEWAIESNITGARVTSTMQDYAHRLDSSRLVTTAISGGCGQGTSTVLDVMGFNYMRQCNIDEYHNNLPGQPGMGTEETTTRMTRGIYKTDSIKGYMMATDRVPAGHSIEDGFNFYEERPFLAGLFFWTGFDYRGEPHPFGWPQVNSQCGIVDLCGFPKDPFFYLKANWSDEPVLHILPHWNWKGSEGSPIKVWAYSNCDEVELFLNSKSLGRKKIVKNSHLEWTVYYQPGTLLAKGFKNDKVISIEKTETTDNPFGIKLEIDRQVIHADGEDVSVITVKVSDKNGRLVPTADNEIYFSLDGPGKIIGVGNGDPSSHEPDKFVDSVGQVTVENLKFQTMARGSIYSETHLDFDDSTWPPAVDDQGNYAVKLKDSSKVVIIRGTFNMPVLTKNAEITLWPKSLGEIQSVYINGTLIADNIKRNDAVKLYKLDNSMLRTGKNCYSVVGVPLVPRYQYDNLNTDPGIVQVYMPARQWKRRLFNGLAQVIVQSLKQPGEIKLKVLSAGIKPAEIKIITKATILRPAVPE
jgi:beta-galactosidase